MAYLVIHYTKKLGNAPGEIDPDEYVTHLYIRGTGTTLCGVKLYKCREWELTQSEHETCDCKKCQKSFDKMIV